MIRNNNSLILRLLAARVQPEQQQKPRVTPVCEPNKQMRQADKKGFKVINNVSWRSWRTCRSTWPTALIRSYMAVHVGRARA